MAGCIDISKFGYAYAVERDPAYKAEYGHKACVHDPWLLLIPCRHGHIYPHGGSRLAISLDPGHDRLKMRLLAIGCTLHQDSDDDGATLLFDAAILGRVAKVVKPKRRPRLSVDERKRRSELGRATIDGARSVKKRTSGDLGRVRSH